jgi:hypothetical protein
MTAFPAARFMRTPPTLKDIKAIAVELLQSTCAAVLLTYQLRRLSRGSIRYC